MNDKNFFDDDDALDYTLYEEAKKNEISVPRKGCFGMILLFIISVTSLGCLIFELTDKVIYIQQKIISARIIEPAILIRINKKFSDSMSQQELFEVSAILLPRPSEMNT